VGLGDLTAALQTRFGTWTALRLLLVVCMVFALRAQLRVRLGQDERTEDPQARVFWLAWLGFGAAVLATVTMSSHSAAGDRPALSLPVNLLHLLTSAVWLAGVCVLVTALPVALGTRRERIQVRLFAPTLASFARLAFRAVLLTALTGALNTLAVIGDFGGLRASRFGQALEVKVWLFLWILAFGGLNHFVLMRRLQAAGAGREGAGPMRSVAGGVSAELAFGVLLLASTAVLTGLSPP
jgi:copper transport protein